MACLLLLGLLAAPATADEADVDAEPDTAQAREEALQEARQEAVDDARDELRAASQRLSAARGATRLARAAGRAADGAVRSAEDAIVPVVLDRHGAEEQLRQARLEVRALRRALRDSEAELEGARERLADRVVRAYKQGSIAADTALPLLAVWEVSSPGELAHTLKGLEVLALTGATEVGDLVARIARLEAEIVAATGARQAAAAAVETAANEVEEREREATARRRAAAGAEARLLAVIERELAAEKARDDARERLDRALEQQGDDVPGTVPGTAAEGDDGSDDGTDDGTDDEVVSIADLLRGRQRAHARQTSVPEERRRTADDWVCPVEGSRFINDWAFPRSQDRKHEGTDVFAPTGTPVHAVTDGVVMRMSTVDRYDGRSGFGGITVTYEQDDQRFYNAHLNAIHPDMAIGHEVRAGDVIGWVGRTGNARGTPPHLHFGWYVADAAVNPFASLAVACRPGRDAEPDDLADQDEMQELKL